MSTQVQTEPIATRVALHPFLAGMSRAQLAILTDCAMATHFKKGQTILREGEFANRFYLVESGKVVLESGDRLRRTRRGPKQLAREICSDGHGCSHHTSGNSLRGRLSRPQRSFSTAPSCGNIAKKTTR